MIGVTGAGRVLMKPAAAGTGVIPGGAARIILEEAGIHDVLCKSLGSANHINVARPRSAGQRRCSCPTRSQAARARRRRVRAQGHAQGVHERSARGGTATERR